jgi:ATP-dependent protease HslVU (ClpYQ) peptidase subunit
VPVIADYAAIGSGGMFAMGAMAHGATAEEAVAAAALHDKNTGGNIQSLHHSVLRS